MNKKEHCQWGRGILANCVENWDSPKKRQKLGLSQKRTDDVLKENIFHEKKLKRTGLTVLFSVIYFTTIL